MKSLGLEDPRYFPYLSPPPPENLRAALEALALLGATDVAAVSSPSSSGAGPGADAAAGGVAGKNVSSSSSKQRPAQPENGRKKTRRWLTILDVPMGRTSRQFCCLH